MLPLQTSELIRDSQLLELLSGNLEFEQAKCTFEQFIGNHQIGFVAYMPFQSVHAQRKNSLISTISFNEIEVNNQYVMIKVKRHTQHLKESSYEQTSEVSDSLVKLEQKLKNQSNKQESQIRSHLSFFIMQTDKDLDMACISVNPFSINKRTKKRTSQQILQVS